MSEHEHEDEGEYEQHPVFYDSEGNEINPADLSESQLRELYQHMGKELQYLIAEQEGEDGYEHQGEEQASQVEQQSQLQDSIQGEVHQHEEINDPSPNNYQKHQQQRRDSDDEEDIDHELIYRQAKRTLLENLNKVRREKKLGPLYLELLTGLIADRYANYLIDEEHDQGIFKSYVEQYRHPSQTAGQDFQMVYIVSKYEEDIVVTSEMILNYFIEMGYLFLEVDSDKKYLLSNELNHIAIGVSANSDQIVIVLIISKRDFTIQKVEDGPDNQIVVHGKMLEDTVGVYAMQIINLKDQPKPNDKNDLNKIGPEHIEFDKQTRCFIARINNQGSPCSRDYQYYIDIYTRNNPDSIPYKKVVREKLKFNYLDHKLRIPVMAFPDPRYAHEDEAERKKQEEELQAQQVSEQRSINPDNSQIQSDQHSNMSDEVKQDDNFDSDQFQPRKLEMPKDQQFSNKDIREELEIAIGEAQRQHDELFDHNITLQAKIKSLRNRQEVQFDKNGEMTMNEHKYLNTLAHVHQIRLDLKRTEETYNQMAYDLQQKLEDKSKKCSEIKQQFMELKREVARKATFSRTDKPIPEKQIIEWEEAELQKNKGLQELRLDTLRLKNTLAKNQKQLKKKEELAEGLHLIDFEQLKIENQTLNEKIEERTEDLHKLKNKNTKTVQILTHTKEKLGFVKAKFEKLETVNADKKKILDGTRDFLSKQKAQKDLLRMENLKLKQQTGIVNRPELIQDYLSRRQRIEELKLEQNKLDDQLRSMQQVIEKYHATIKQTQQQPQQQIMKSKTRQL